MKTIKDYHDLYLKCDVLLLADIFEKFRNNSLKSYGLCSSYYLSTPALSWDAMFDMTKVGLEVISDADMYFFVGKGMRGESSYISKRHSDANNIYGTYYGPTQESKRITYLEANNLYGYGMSKFLLTIRFKWIDPQEFDLNKYTSNSSKVCVLEVAFECPKQLRKLHNDYPLARDKIEIKREILSSYWRC